MQRGSEAVHRLDYFTVSLSAKEEESTVILRDTVLCYQTGESRIAVHPAPSFLRPLALRLPLCQVFSAPWLGCSGVHYLRRLFFSPAAVPGGIAPESLTFTPLDDMIFLKWEEPVEPNGLITQYEVGNH